VKKLIPALLLITFMSCTKEQITSPVPNNQSVSASSSPISLKTDNIFINDFKAQQAGGNKTIVSFNTLFQKEVKTLEILKGTSENNLCSIYIVDITDDTFSSIQYLTEDKPGANSASLYYMVKFTLQNNDWGYTPVYTLRCQQ